MELLALSEENLIFTYKLKPHMYRVGGGDASKKDFSFISCYIFHWCVVSSNNNSDHNPSSSIPVDGSHVSLGDT